MRMMRARGTLVVTCILAAVAGCAPADRDPAPDPAQDTTANIVPGTSARPAPDSGAVVTVFFSRGETVAAVRREVAADAATLEAALRALLSGPDAAERAAGLHSWFSPATADRLRSVSIDPEGTAVVDFLDLRDVIPNASTSAGSAMLLRELNATVFAQSSVQAVQYRMEGSCELFWEWLQYGCETVRRP